MSPVSFTKDTAAKTGRSRRTVERMVKLGKSLDDEAARLLANTPFADNSGVLTKLARLPGEAQRRAAEKLAGGQARTVEAATGASASAPTTPHDANRGLTGLRTVVAALKSCGIYNVHEGAVLTIKHALEHYTKDADAEDASEPDEETMTWTG